jgi:hypothetical protein
MDLLRNKKLKLKLIISGKLLLKVILKELTLVCLRREINFIIIRMRIGSCYRQIIILHLKIMKRLMSCQEKKMYIKTIIDNSF